jgi:hypothetical protein
MKIIKIAIYSIFFLYIASVVTFNYLMGSIPNTRFGHDLPLLLDGGWRVYSGQIPHTDFNSAIGFFPFLILSIAIHIVGNVPNALGLSDSLIFIFVSLLAIYLTNKKLPLMYSIIFTICIGLFAIAPNAIGLDYNELTYAGRYNRIGFAMITLLAFDLFTVNFKDDKVYILNTIILGVILSILFYTKINYFLLGLGYLLLSQLIYKKYKNNFCILFFTLLIIFIVALAFKINLLNLLNNYFYPIINRFDNLRFDIIFKYIKVLYIPLIIQLASYAALIFIYKKLIYLKSKEITKIILISIVIIITSLLLSITSTAPFSNFENILFHLPLILLLNYIFVNNCNSKNYFYIINYSSNHNKLILINGLFFIILLLNIYFSSIPNNMKSFIFSSNKLSSNVALFSYERLVNSNLDGIIITNGGGNNQFEDELPYGKVVAYGIDLLNRQNLSKNNVIFVANFTNPFNFGLSLKPNTPDNLYWSDDNDYIDSDKLFKHVDYVLWFKLTDRLIELYKNNRIDLNREMKNRYFNDIKKDFHVVDKNEAWYLYKKN